MAGLLERLKERASRLPVGFEIHTGHGVEHVGGGPARFTLRVRNPRGLRALTSLSELAISDAYIRGDLDLEGDAVAAMSLRTLFSDIHPWTRTWRWLRPLLVGRVRCNPAWIAKHYDADNVQLIAADQVYHTYTPGLYESDDDTLEAGAARKLAFAFQSLGLRAGDRLLDVGCGWGGFLRYAARRGVRATGITLSRHQLEYAREQLRGDGLEADVLYQDFFTYEPTEPFDGVSAMGVMEDLADYRAVVNRLSRIVRPGGRVYFDFATSLEPVSTFITKYIWPGTFRMVDLPELVGRLGRSPFQIVALYNDRRNYYLWARGMHDRWIQRRADVLQRASEATWRTFRLLYAGGTHVMSEPSCNASAYRMVLERTGS
jgi:cyclopropane-fatty-acyl-phospholipid synthase